MKKLFEIETQLEVAKEKLIMRCKEFNNRSVVLFFEATPDDVTINLNVVNIKKVYQKVGISIDNSFAGQVLARFDSNFDSELTYTDVSDMFKPKSLALQKELE